MSRYIWLDCDPGHDDATAILLAVHTPGINILGVSTVHGNTNSDNTASNAARCLEAVGADTDIKVYPGASKPLLRLARHDPQIHGLSGLDGVEGLPSATDPEVLARIARMDGHTVHAIEAMASTIRLLWDNGKGPRVTVVSTGPMTNIALFVSVYPDLLQGIDEFVFMGGGVGLGNRSSSAEFNILCDPEAAQIVLDVPVKKTMIPLNVTHTAIVTREVHRKLLSPGSPAGDETTPLPPAITPLRHMLSTLVSFFAEAYKETFGFVRGPPIHDALTIAYVAHPEFFASRRFRVDVELNGAHTVGETVVDLWNYGAWGGTWGKGGKNCLVAETLDVDKFFEMFLDCIAECDKVSPLNQ